MSYIRVFTLTGLVLLEMSLFSMSSEMRHTSLKVWKEKAIELLKQKKGASHDLYQLECLSDRVHIAEEIVQLMHDSSVLTISNISIVETAFKFSEKHNDSLKKAFTNRVKELYQDSIDEFIHSPSIMETRDRNAFLFLKYYACDSEKCLIVLRNAINNLINDSSFSGSLVHFLHSLLKYKPIDAKNLFDQLKKKDFINASRMILHHKKRPKFIKNTSFDPINILKEVMQRYFDREGTPEFKKDCLQLIVCDAQRYHHECVGLMRDFLNSIFRNQSSHVPIEILVGLLQSPSDEIKKAVEDHLRLFIKNRPSFKVRHETMDLLYATDPKTYANIRNNFYINNFKCNKFEVTNILLFDDNKALGYQALAYYLKITPEEYKALAEKYNNPDTIDTEFINKIWEGSKINYISQHKILRSNGVLQQTINSATQIDLTLRIINNDRNDSKERIESLLYLFLLLDVNIEEIENLSINFYRIDMFFNALINICKQEVLFEKRIEAVKTLCTSEFYNEKVQTIFNKWLERNVDVDDKESKLVGLALQFFNKSTQKHDSFDNELNEVIIDFNNLGLNNLNQDRILKERFRSCMSIYYTDLTLASKKRVDFEQFLSKLSDRSFFKMTLR